MIVMKFGGTSVQDANAIQNVINIVSTRLKEKALVVVSAMSKVTRQLLRLAELAEQGNKEEVLKGIDSLKERHFEVASQLLDKENIETAKTEIAKLLSELQSFLLGISEIRELSDKSQAKILGYGELLSSWIVTLAFNKQGIKAKRLDARELLITNNNYLSAKPDIPLSSKKVKEEIVIGYKEAEVLVIQGFIASSTDGDSTVLGFEGSDYSAAIFGSICNADRVEIWTDVDGICVTDPRVVEKPRSISALSYEEAAEMAYLGARVLHPYTIEPCRAKNIPIYVLNSHNINYTGTIVDNARHEEITALAFRSDICLIRIDLPDFGQVTDALNFISQQFKQYNINISLLNTDTSAIILTADKQESIDEACESIRQKYSLYIEKNKAQISIVGRNISKKTGLIDVINKISPNAELLSIGAKQMNISFVINLEDLDHTINQLYKEV